MSQTPELFLKFLELKRHVDVHNTIPKLRFYLLMMGHVMYW